MCVYEYGVRHTSRCIQCILSSDNNIKLANICSCRYTYHYYDYYYFVSSDSLGAHQTWAQIGAASKEIDR